MSGTEFMADGLCAQTDPDLFHPNKGEPTAAARGICRRCPVQDQCLEYALTHDERYGIWGGVSAVERRRLRREQVRATCGQLARAEKQATARRMRATGRSKAEICRLLRLSGATVNAYLSGGHQGEGG